LKGGENMAATFSVAQYYGAGGGTATLLGATGSLWYFKQATSSGTADYNTPGSNVPANQNSFAFQARPYFSTTATNTFSNIRFYRSGGVWTSTAYGVNATSATGYTQSTSSSTVFASGGASNATIPTSSATGSAIALGTLSLGNATGYGPTYLRVQLTTTDTAPAGDLSPETFTWVYDES
jgi:hypothetical protein